VSDCVCVCACVCKRVCEGVCVNACQCVHVRNVHDTRANENKARQD